MKRVAFSVTLFLLIGVGDIGESQERESPEETLRRFCTAEKVPRYFCEVHGVSFEPIEVPIVYGLLITEENFSSEVFGFIEMARSEKKCRYTIARNTEFPNAAPEYQSGGCEMMEGAPDTGLTCACRLCTEAHRQWKWACTYCGSPRAGGSRDEHESLPTETALFLRIQQLRAFEETEVADCLQSVWNRKFGSE